jgi:hypothetical protein
VLYELLTGERLFSGEDAAETLAAVVHKQPDFARAPESAQRLLEECLQKDPKQQLRDIGDAKRLIRDNSPAETAPSTSRAGLGGVGRCGPCCRLRTWRLLRPFSRAASQTRSDPFRHTRARQDHLRSCRACHLARWSHPTSGADTCFISSGR